MLTRIIFKKALTKKINRIFSEIPTAENILKETCYYNILGLEKASTRQEIKKKYRDLTKTYHPDLWRDNRAHQVYSKILNAYTILEDEKKRRIYNNFIDKNSKNDQNFEEKWQKHQSYNERASRPYDYWNRRDPTNHADFSSWNQNDTQEDKYYHQQAQKDRQYYARARKAGKRMSSEESENTRKDAISIGWIILLGLTVYIFGFGNIVDIILGKNIDKKKLVEMERSKQELLLESDKKNDSETTISNRIVEFQREMNEKKIVISVEDDTMTLKNKNKEVIPKSIKMINRRMSKENPKFKLVKSEKKKIQKREISLRQHYESFSTGEMSTRKQNMGEKREPGEFDKELVEELEGGYI